MKATGFVLAPRALADAETVAPRPRVVGKGAEVRRFDDALRAAEVEAPPRPTKPVGPTDPLRHAVFLSKTLRRA